MSDEEIIRYFGSNHKSIEFRRFAEIIHSQKLDWFKTDIKNEIARFGRKDISSTRAKCVMGSVYLNGELLTVGINKPYQNIITVTNQPLTENIVDKIDQELNISKPAWSNKLNLIIKRDGHWPTDY